jgi:hypothetical protein
LKRVIFRRGSRLRDLAGFRKCESLISIEIPSNVEVIRDESFKKCIALETLSFGLGIHLREIGGFSFCESLSQIEFPHSIEIIREGSFRACQNLRVISFPSGSRIREIRGFKDCVLTIFNIPSFTQIISVGRRSFLLFTDQDYVKHNRRRLHLQSRISISPLRLDRPFRMHPALKS